MKNRYFTRMMDRINFIFENEQNEEHKNTIKMYKLLLCGKYNYIKGMLPVSKWKELEKKLKDKET